MKEKEFIEIIKSTLKSDYIGDDCAYLRDLGIVISQDSLVEDVHFKLDFITPYKLGWKSAMVNISDVCASGAEPKYLTVALSLPKNIDGNFVEEFYRGMKTACGDVEIVGGDITGSDKIFISVTAIGKCEGRRISSRSSAKIGQKIVVSGVHGSSGAGLRLLLAGERVAKEDEKFVDAHLMPVAEREFSRAVSCNISEDYAMMDTSDGLADALSQISSASGVNLEIDFEKIPYDKDLKKFTDFKDLIFFGGEDYRLVATVPESLDEKFTVIGEVKFGNGITLTENGKKTHFTKSDIEQKLFKHF